MSSNIVPEIVAVEQDCPDRSPKKQFSPIGLKYCVPTPEGKIHGLLQRLLADTGFAPNKHRIQVRFHGAGNHPTHPAMLMGVREFYRTDDDQTEFPFWREVDDEHMTTFKGLQALRDSVRTMKKLRRTNMSKKTPKKTPKKMSDGAGHCDPMAFAEPDEPVQVGEEQPPADPRAVGEAAGAGILAALTRVVQSVEGLIATGKPVAHDLHKVESVKFSETREALEAYFAYVDLLVEKGILVAPPSSEDEEPPPPED